MAIDEHSRHELFSRLEQVLGFKHATVLMEHLPPVGWADVATKRDLDHLEERLDARIDLVDARLETTEQRLLATFRAEMNAQTRTMVFSMTAALAAMAAVAFAAARLA